MIVALIIIVFACLISCLIGIGGVSYWYYTRPELNPNNSDTVNTSFSPIDNAKFIITNDTGPAHIASHLDKQGIVLFGSHTTPKKVSIENYNFKAISVENLKDLGVDTVLKKMKAIIN